MNEIANKFLSARAKFMLERQLRQSGFTYRFTFIKNKERIHKFKETDMAYTGFKDLTRRFW